GSDRFETLTDAAGPMHLDVGGRLGAEAKVQAPVVHRQEARLPGHLLELLTAAIANQRPGTDGAAVGFGGVQLELEPAVVAFDVLAKKRWGLVGVANGKAELPIVVQIPEGAAAATVRGANPGPTFLQ